jgi:ankyrin repeat protein
VQLAQRQHGRQGIHEVSVLRALRARLRPGGDAAIVPGLARIESGRSLSRMTMRLLCFAAGLLLTAAGPSLADSPLHVAARTDDAAAIELLVPELGVDRTNTYHATPLHLAAQAGALGASQALIAADADIAALDARSWMPLHYAAREGHVEVAQLLIAHGASVEWRGRDDLSPLQLASRAGHLEVVGALIEAGARVNARHRTHPSALHLAVMGNHPAVVDALLEAGADVSARAGRGVTPLHLAALEADPDIVAALVAAGARRDAPNADGRTPLQVAKRAGREEALLPSVAAE